MMKLRKIKLIIFSMMFLLTSKVFVLADTDNTNKTKKKLTDKENPELIGKRNINKGTIQFYSTEKELGIGQQLAADLDRQLKFINDPIIAEYINRVGQNIALNSDAKFPFTIKVVDSEEVNAFALPGGFFYVNKGLILAAANEDELVCVMAHEIAHVAARHSTEQVSKGQLLSIGSIPLIFLGGIGGVIAQNGANILFPLTFLKFTRSAETEADMLGVQYAWASGYDPNGLTTFFEKLQSREKKKPGTVAKLFATHPTNADRLIKVRDLISRLPDHDEYIINTSEFKIVQAQLRKTSANKHGRFGRGSNNESPQKPTLKRRKDTDLDPTDTTDGTDTIDKENQTPEPRERPTLKRRTKEQEEEKEKDFPEQSP